MAATFTPGIAPGGIMSIFGSGLAGQGSATTVDFDGVAAAVLLGVRHSRSTRSCRRRWRRGCTSCGAVGFRNGAADGDGISTVAPAIFLIGDPPAGAVVNQDNTLERAVVAADAGTVRWSFMRQGSGQWRGRAIYSS